MRGLSLYALIYIKVAMKARLKDDSFAVCEMSMALMKIVRKNCGGSLWLRDTIETP